MPTIITSERIEKALSYTKYRQLIDELLNNNQTTGNDHSSVAYVNYTKMNVQRMTRLDKTIKITPELEQAVLKIQERQVWLVITEAWCGDAAQNIPIIAKVAALNPKIDLKLILRDQNLDVMDAYLTNGSRSIPKVIFLNNKLEELNTWGSRPKAGQEMVTKLKSEGMDSAKSIEQLHGWYAKNKGIELQKELYEILK